jgi:hypothetical protein
MMVLRNRLAGFLAGFLPDVTSKRRSRLRAWIQRSAKSPLLGSKAGWSERLPRGQRVLDGIPGVRGGGWLKTLSKASNAVSVEMSVSDVAMIP